MKVADRASGEAPELKVDEITGGVWDRNQLAGGRGQFQRWEGLAYACLVARAGGCGGGGAYDRWGAAVPGLRQCGVLSAEDAAGAGGVYGEVVC